VHWATTRRWRRKRSPSACTARRNSTSGRVFRVTLPLRWAPFSVGTHSRELDDCGSRDVIMATPPVPERNTRPGRRFGASFDTTCPVWSHPRCLAVCSEPADEYPLATAWVLSGRMPVSFRSASATHGVECHTLRLGSCVVDIWATETGSAPLV
jgi:hypothetical protein